MVFPALDALNQLFCYVHILGSALGTLVMVVNGRAEAGSLGNLDVSGDGGLKQTIVVVLSQLIDYLK